MILFTFLHWGIKMSYWYVEYEEKLYKEATKIFLVEGLSCDLAALTALRFIGKGKCTIVPLTVGHLIKRFKFYHGVSVYND